MVESASSGGELVVAEDPAVEESWRGGSQVAVKESWRRWWRVGGGGELAMVDGG